jgi:hypothetical protein
MAKDVEKRYASMSELRADLKTILHDSQTGSLDSAVTMLNIPAIKTTEAPATKSRRSLLWFVAPLLILGLTAGVYWKYFRQEPASDTNFQSVKLDVLTAHGLTSAVAIAPDGKIIAYAKDEDGKHSLWLRQTASAGDTQIVPAGETRYDYLKFSSDGNFLYFVGTEAVGQPSSLFQITTLGLNRRKLISGVDSQRLPEQAWCGIARTLSPSPQHPRQRQGWSQWLESQTPQPRRQKTVGQHRYK